MVISTIRGRITEEDKKFLRFINAVQETANEKGYVFFMDIADTEETYPGNIFGVDLYGQILHGWFIPEPKAEEFAAVFLSDDIPLIWNDYVISARYNTYNDVITIDFGNNTWKKYVANKEIAVQYPQYIQDTRHLLRKS